MRRLVSPGILAMLVLLVVAGGHVFAQSPDILAEGGVDSSFEGGLDGWTVVNATTGGGGPVWSGGSAAHLTAQAAGAMRIETKYWLVTASAGASHTLRAQNVTIAGSS